MDKELELIKLELFDYSKIDKDRLQIYKIQVVGHIKEILDELPFDLIFTYFQNLAMLNNHRKLKPHPRYRDPYREIYYDTLFVYETRSKYYKKILSAMNKYNFFK